MVRIQQHERQKNGTIYNRNIIIIMVLCVHDTYQATGMETTGTRTNGHSRY